LSLLVALTRPGGQVGGTGDALLFVVARRYERQPVIIHPDTVVRILDSSELAQPKVAKVGPACDDDNRQSPGDALPSDRSFY
jgi:hypothetical protein